MPFTALATKVYRGPIDVVWANSIKSNDDLLITGIAKAFVIFDGSGATLSSRASFNISSLTDSGVGRYTIAFTTGFTNTSYVMYGGIEMSATSTTPRLVSVAVSGVDTGSCGIEVQRTNDGTYLDDVVRVCFMGLQK